jgi:hypothetical protein
MRNIFCSVVAVICAIAGHAQKITRGPYLNSVTSTSVVIRWRTDKPVASHVAFGKSITLGSSIAEEKAATEHEVLINGLQPASRYYYSIASKNQVATAAEDQYFQTAPVKGSSEPVRVWALGDFGNSSQNQIACRDAITKSTLDRRADAWIWLGDNAYSKGKDSEYQEHVFNIYQESFFKNTTLYPSPGNHDYGDHVERNGVPYFNIFTLPQRGETGGVPSGSESFYAVDYGNVHLVSLDSYGKGDDGLHLYDTLSKQMAWLKNDLASNTLPWVVLYFHHPPYSKGSHDSDTEESLVKMRENFIPIIERYHVDLVLAGHSHVYERTHPIRGHYGASDSFDFAKHVVAKTDAPSQYHVDGKEQGIIYVINGSGGQVGGQQNGYPLKAAIYSNNTIGGSMILDFSGNKLDARWICADGVVRDQFSIVKDNINE